MAVQLRRSMPNNKSWKIRTCHVGCREGLGSPLNMVQAAQAGDFQQEGHGLTPIFVFRPTSPQRDKKKYPPIFKSLMYKRLDKGFKLLLWF